MSRFRFYSYTTETSNGRKPLRSVKRLGLVSRRPSAERAYKRTRQVAHHYEESARVLSHFESPLRPAFLRYPAFSFGVQRNSTRAVEGFLMGGLPMGRFGLSMAYIMPVQIVLDNPSHGLYSVRTVTQRHGENNMLTKDQTSRILEAITECDRYIAKEGPRAADLRPAWATKALEHAKTHKAKLQNALTIGVWVVS